MKKKRKLLDLDHLDKMKKLKTPQEYFSDLVSENRAKMKLPDAFDDARQKFEREKGLAAPYSDCDSFRNSRKYKK